MVKRSVLVTGEIVLITTGSGARLALRNQFEPVDAVIVGIVDP